MLKILGNLRNTFGNDSGLYIKGISSVRIAEAPVLALVFGKS